LTAISFIHELENAGGNCEPLLAMIVGSQRSRLRRVQEVSMMKPLMLVVAALMLSAGAASAQTVYVAPTYPAPVYVAPAPIYVAPAPVYVALPPAVVPSYAAPGPAVTVAAPDYYDYAPVGGTIAVTAPDW
jgi:hypothetical protein